MFEKLLEVLKMKENLLDQSKTEAFQMLYTCQEMFMMVNRGIKEEVDSSLRDTIHRIDRKINKQQRNVRKMVFEHLSISSSGDLLTGLQLLNVVIDTERIGDYTKNIADLVDMLPKKFDFGEYDADFREFEKTSEEIFRQTIEALEKDDSSCAEKALDLFDQLAKKCDQRLGEIMGGKASGDLVEKRYLAMVLLLRYIKRVGAHLCNISTTVVRPFHKFGYRG